MRGLGFFDNLKGYFSQPEKKSLHRVTPEQHKALVESDYLERIIRELGHGEVYAPEDIIGVAFATTHRGEGVQFRQLYLTHRGIKESKDTQLRIEYRDLVSKVVVKTDSLLKLCERPRGFQSLVERFSENPVEFVNLEGADKMKRVLIVYSCDATKYFAVQENASPP
ncbi:hypothetical protein FJZ18_03200 [Candidatus Pacearchaeota archaeon]|nr:hypothetical protein [Candidatus Pacearchaeota archaeon]